MERSANWNIREVKLLIDLMDEFKDEFKKCTNKKELRLKIASRMSEEGFNRNEAQIKKKIEYLKTKFHQEKNKSSGSAPSTWQHFDAMGQIFHSSHYYNQDNCVITDSFDSSSTSEENQINEFRRGRKRKSLVAIDNFEKKLKETFESEHRVTLSLINTIETMQNKIETMQNKMEAMENKMENKMQSLETKTAENNVLLNRILNVVQNNPTPLTSPVHSSHMSPLYNPLYNPFQFNQSSYNNQ